MKLSQFTAHPWHGVAIGDEAPSVVTAFIEIVPSDTIKYEIDKASGLMKVDRPQKYSSLPPALYGFIPQTYCDERIRALANDKKVTSGDHDPLDICVITERSIGSNGFLVRARTIGGLRLIDEQEADDKIIAVMADDPIYGSIETLKDAPQSLIDRIRHYFLTYKDFPGQKRKIEMGEVYERDVACKVIEAAVADYKAKFHY
ncbi:inorganic pyrophosphatase [Turneriella parva]|uniref:inorganic diphosphatase n=1 Tax=Turneriella parva (strain ATCC BAA-1111 / DSM 21527 / NCTC 11395 / H) TaxID=869212 RepID=I4B5A2_TURPD|nr:inorganic pyrophosphatase [Turneriella parva]AFM12459.1 Inorganic pyrophosphatase [Turneriella parva DSM 21527]